MNIGPLFVLVLKNQKNWPSAQAKKKLKAYRVLGYSDTGGEPQAFLSKGSKIFIAGPGTMLEASIQVAAVTKDAVTLLETKSQVEALLPYSPPSKK